MKTINLREYNTSYADFNDWCIETGAEVFALIHHGGNGPSAEYGFENDEDLLAFKLKFSPGNDLLLGYKGITSVDVGYFNCPYIPFIKYEKN